MRGCARLPGPLCLWQTLATIVIYRKGFFFWKSKKVLRGGDFQECDWSPFRRPPAARASPYMHICMRGCARLPGPLVSLRYWSPSPRPPAAFSTCRKAGVARGARYILVTVSAASGRQSLSIHAHMHAWLRAAPWASLSLANIGHHSYLSEGPFLL